MSLKLWHIAKILDGTKIQKIAICAAANIVKIPNNFHRLGLHLACFILMAGTVRLALRRRIYE
jgi:hypothetical protein